MALFSYRSTIVQFVLFLLASSVVNSSAIHRRAVIAYNAVVGFPQSVPDTPEGASALKYKPFLDVVNGCVPFPAVDALGNIGGGLPTSGSHNSGCSSNLGQVYTRSASYANKFAIMYSWYFPKDSPSPGLGHRHDWECAIIWLSSPIPSPDQKVLAVSTSAHGKFDTFKPPFSDMVLDGTTGRPKIQYFSFWPINHQMGVTLKRGGEQPLIAWESLTEEARGSLQRESWGSGTVPFKDSTFLANLEKANP